jgi:hypothetical protein
MTGAWLFLAGAAALYGCELWLTIRWSKKPVA